MSLCACELQHYIQRWPRLWSFRPETTQRNEVGHVDGKFSSDALQFLKFSPTLRLSYQSGASSSPSSSPSSCSDYGPLVDISQGVFHSHFYPNVTTLRSGLCYRNSVCRLSVCLSSVCRLSSVTLVHPTQGVEPFGKISSPLCTLAILWPPCKVLRRSSQGNPSVGGVKRKRGIKIERFRTYRRLYLTNGTR